MKLYDKYTTIFKKYKRGFILNFKILLDFFYALIILTPISLSLQKDQIVTASSSFDSIVNCDFTQACKKFDEIKHRFELYKDTCEETYELLMGAEALSLPLNSYADNAQSYIETVAFLKNYYINTGGSKDSYLEPFFILLGGFLEKRFEFLKGRRDNKILFQSGEVEAVYLRSTYPEYVESLDKEGLGAFELVSYYLIQDFYQTMNYCIIELFHMVSPESFEEKNKAVLHTKKLLQFSVNLWPYLINTSFEDFGHPDQAIEEYQDLDLYRKFILKDTDPNIVIKRESLGHPLFRVRKLESDVVSDVVLFDAAKPSDLQKMTKKKKKKKHKKKQSQSQISAVENSIDGDDAESDVEISEIDIIEEKSALDKDLERVGCKGGDVKTEESKDTVTLKQEDIAFERKKYVKKIDGSKKKATLSSLDEEKVAVLKLTGTHKTTFEQIMQTPFSGSLAYRSFESLWQHLGGAIRATSGSHRKLLWNNQCMGGTYEPHGGHSYGYRTVKYLREALDNLCKLSGLKL